MKDFLKGLFSNRFGIVLAALNVSFFASMDFYRGVFAHVHGESCFFFGKKFFFVPLILSDTEDLMLILNLPAVLFSHFPTLLCGQYFGESCALSQIKIQFLFFSAFVVLQWLSIARIGRRLAAK